MLTKKVFFCWNMWLQDGLPCFFLWNMWWSNISFWLQRFMMMFWKTTLLVKIWTSFVTWSSFWLCMPFCHVELCAYLDQVCIISQLVCLWFYWCGEYSPTKALLAFQWFLEQIWWPCIWHELNAFETFTNKNLLVSWCLNLSGEEVDHLVIFWF